MNNRSANFYVITGGPGVGKTTFIEGLRSIGFQTIEEDARRIIQEQVITKGDALPWKNKVNYAKLMFDSAIKNYETILKSKDVSPVFFDRSIIDTLCYMRMEKVPISDDMIRLIKQCSYHKNVFILPPWKSIYRTDHERKQNWTEAKTTYGKMKEAYLSFGYQVIDVPKLSRTERVQFMIQQLKMV